MKKRIGIFVFYDREGIVDRYVLFYLTELIQVLERLIIVVNGNISDSGMKQLKEITKDIIVRENIGYDGGAHKDILMNYLGEEELKSYDELVLCNDTCFGPFVSFKSIFETMEKKKCDFWGINYLENNILAHVQGYFLVFRRNVLFNGDVFLYFKEYVNELSTDLDEVIPVFEIGLSHYLMKKGYVPQGYIENNNVKMYVCDNILIKKYGFPFLKKKSFDKIYDQYMGNRIDALTAIQEKFDYDIEYILEHVKRLYDFDGYEKGMENPYSIVREEYEYDFGIEQKELKACIENENKIYVYGAGIWAKRIYFLYLKRNTAFKGFIVSDDKILDTNTMYGYPVQRLSEVPRDALIIIGLNQKNTEEVRRKLVIFNKVLGLWGNLKG